MIRPWLLLLWLAPAATVLAAVAEPRKATLQEQQGSLRGRIESLSQDLAKKEESRADVAERLREAESAISDVNRRLRELGGERRVLEGELADLETQSVQLERQTATQQSQLARLLHRQFVGGEADTLQMLLAGRDPNQAARDRYFLTQLSRAKAELIAELRRVAERKQQLADHVRERRGKLADNEKRQQESRDQLVDKQKQRQAMLAALASQIKSQRAEIGALKRNEQRLSTLIADLAKAAARRKPKVGVTEGNLRGTGETAPPRPAAAARTPAGKPVANADPGAVGEFGALRGKLRLPVAGTVAARFGSPRAEGGTNWRGIFIRAAEGTDVKAVAAGTVVFSDWLRGFGNLLIVDHDDDFLSVYGNNQTLLHGAGKRVAAGEVLASVGNTGGNPESGLYFELRHRGQPFDPLQWTRR